MAGQSKGWSGRAREFSLVLALGLSTIVAAPILHAAPPSALQALTAQDLSGKTIDPFSLAAGKPLVLIFVRTDCPISNRYAPTLKSIGQRYSGEAVFMLVYPDKTETVANIQKHLKEYGYTFAAVRDTQHNLVKVTEVEITPEVAVFNGKRELVYHGRIDDWYKDFGKARPAPTTHELNDAIAVALKGGAAIPSQPAVGCYISDLR